MAAEFTEIFPANTMMSLRIRGADCKTKENIIEKLLLREQKYVAYMIHLLYDR